MSIVRSQAKRPLARTSAGKTTLNAFKCFRFQERFIQNVQMTEEDKEQVKFRCWAGWASEDKMRDELKMKETPGLSL